MNLLVISIIFSIITSSIGYFFVFPDGLEGILALVTFVLSLITYYLMLYFSVNINRLYNQRKTLSDEDFTRYSEILIGTILLGLLGNLTASFIVETFKDPNGIWSIFVIIFFFLTIDSGLWLFLTSYKRSKISKPIKDA